MSFPREDYVVGWICAMPKELIAAKAMLDVIHNPLKTQPKHDNNSYILGSIGEHNVVIACLPEYGAVSAAVTAKSMQNTFPRLQFGLMVGTGGGIPSENNDIRLGDIVVSMPTGQHGGVIQYDLGGRGLDGFRRIGMLNKPPLLLRNTVNVLRAERGLGKRISGLVDAASRGDDDDEEEEDKDDWTYPSTTRDILFKSTFDHIGNNPDCDACAENISEIKQRHERKFQNPKIFYGNIASTNSVMENARERDTIAKRESVICFEREAAGLMDNFPCLVIRGICNYADSHKNKKWQPYAASVAAAYAKTLLYSIRPEAVESLDPIRSESFLHFLRILCPPALNLDLFFEPGISGYKSLCCHSQHTLSFPRP